MGNLCYNKQRNEKGSYGDGSVKLIIGLGNPGNRYDGTRHNIGFHVIDTLMKRHGLIMMDQKFKADYTIWRHPQDKVLLLKPFTYMNLSGEALLPFMSYYGIAMEDIVVVYDDLDLEPGRIRLRQNGSAGGHNGMKSIIQMLGAQDFKRIRVGIGRPQGGWKVVDHVLAAFRPDEHDAVNEAAEIAANALDDWTDGQEFIKIMNTYNQRK